MQRAPAPHANIVTNVAGNSVAFANGFTLMFPRFIDIRRRQLLCAVLGFAVNPWQIQAKASTFLAFLGGYTIFLGGILGVMATDHWILRPKGLHVLHLFKPHGIYWYSRGINWRAVVAFFLALGPLLPGLLFAMGVPIANKGILNFYSMNGLLAVPCPASSTSASRSSSPCRGMRRRRTPASSTSTTSQWVKLFSGHLFMLKGGSRWGSQLILCKSSN